LWFSIASVFFEASAKKITQQSSSAKEGDSRLLLTTRVHRLCTVLLSVVSVSVGG
jgi:ABC-type enterochelin transport system permease subunit